MDLFTPHRLKGLRLLAESIDRHQRDFRDTIDASIQGGNLCRAHTLGFPSG